MPGRLVFLKAPRLQLYKKESDFYPAATDEDISAVLQSLRLYPPKKYPISVSRRCVFSPTTEALHYILLVK